MAWLDPDIRIGGVPIQSQNFFFSMTSGVRPFIGTVLVPSGLNVQMESIKSPTSIQIAVTGGTRGEPDFQTYTWSNIYLLERRDADDINSIWTFADARWAWRGKKVYFSYNKTRTQNFRGIGVPINISDVDYAQLRNPFDRFSLGRYLDWSVDNGKPWTVSEIIHLELQKLGVFLRSSALPTGGYILENIEMQGVDVYEALEDLLSKGRLNMALDLAGNPYIYSVDFFDQNGANKILSLLERKTRPGKIYITSKKRMRPKKINVRFEAFKEVRVIAGSSIERVTGKPITIYDNPPVWTAQDRQSIPPRVIACENVIRVPYPTGVTV